jgi:hypothetical protein
VAERGPGAYRTRTARAKLTMILDPATFAAGAGKRSELAIECNGQTFRAHLATKSLRRALDVLAELGPDDCALLLQGQLQAGGVIAEAGLSAQPKMKPPQAAAG